jgi:hypothetical protein
MPLIENPDNEKLEAVNFKMAKSLKDEVKQYCKWANIKEKYFFAEAARFVLKKDKEWRALKVDSVDNLDQN